MRINTARELKLENINLVAVFRKKIYCAPGMHCVRYGSKQRNVSYLNSFRPDPDLDPGF
jgi:hypothetical protein